MSRFWNIVVRERSYRKAVRQIALCMRTVWCSEMDCRCLTFCSVFLNIKVYQNARTHNHLHSQPPRTVASVGCLYNFQKFPPPPLSSASQFFAYSADPLHLHFHLSLSLLRDWRLFSQYPLYRDSSECLPTFIYTSVSLNILRRLSFFYILPDFSQFFCFSRNIYQNFVLKKQRIF